MAKPLAAEIRHVDHTLSVLNEHRSRCGDPVDIIQTTEKIDLWLDKRLVLMRGRDGDLDAYSRESVTAG